MSSPISYFFSWFSTHSFSHTETHTNRAIMHFCKVNPFSAKLIEMCEPAGEREQDSMDLKQKSILVAMTEIGRDKERGRGGKQKDRLH